MPFVIDQHPVGALGPYRAHPPLGITVCPWRPRRSCGHQHHDRPPQLRQPTRRGETLLREGDRDYDFYVVTAGTVAVLENGEIIRVHGRGRFLSELGHSPASLRSSAPWCRIPARWCACRSPACAS
ncbi:cyclic nucleotide-binding domain-containing protein [Actinomadura sp. HBU206391]|uniref:cyclic nucleotide-binding domain-containing protein n=1 Tax=Actinomadura sp. HBU206391 TaxID=2731692 RepID=UPI001C9CBDBF